MSRYGIGVSLVLFLGMVHMSFAGEEAVVRLIAVDHLSPFSTDTKLPDPLEVVTVGDTYFVEMWASYTGSTNAGLTSVYVDVTWNALLADVIEITHGHPGFGDPWSGHYLVFRSGAASPGFINELGGSQVDNIAIAPQWERIAVIEIDAVTSGEVTLAPIPGSSGLAQFGIGAIRWSDVTLMPAVVTQECTVDEDCNDDNPCTIDRCNGTTCSHFPSEFDSPFIIHRSGMNGETRPFTGYVDPRMESDNGTSVNMGLTELTFVFNEPVRGQGDVPLSPSSFPVKTTGGLAPNVISVDDSLNPVITVRLAAIPPLREWTTVQAAVEDLCGNPIESEDDLGPGIEEPDRIDFCFLPGDVDQNGGVQPFDLLRFRQILLGTVVPEKGTLLDYVDTNRNGTNNPVDLLRLRQLYAGSGNATREWLGLTALHAQP